MNMPTPGLEWTEGRIELLKKLTADGLSCSQIGRELGVTRNAIIGKQHRIGIYSKNSKGGHLIGTRTSKTSIKIAASPGSKRVRFKRTEFRDLPPETPADPKNIIDVDWDQCHWPAFGDGLETMFCGAPAYGGHSYCYHHCCIAYQAPQPRLTRAERETQIRELRKNYTTAA